MNTDPKVSEFDETPEYPLPSPTDSLSRDQRPPDDDDDDEAGVEQVPDEEGSRTDVEGDAEETSIVGNGDPS
jgi:hypothetical protein